jgi:hypothetical protein
VEVRWPRSVVADRLSFWVSGDIGDRIEFKSNSNDLYQFLCPFLMPRMRSLMFVNLGRSDQFGQRYTLDFAIE